MQIQNRNGENCAIAGRFAHSPRFAGLGRSVDMPTPGLSLVGFITDQQQAIAHLSRACVPVNPDPAALHAEWDAAKAGLGVPIPKAGHPDIQALPAAHDAHVQQVLAHPMFAGPWHGATIQLVEIDPVLAYQMTVDSNRSAHLAAGLSKPPTLDELVTCCLPLAPAPENFDVFPGLNSMVLKARSLNVRAFQGFWRTDALGINFGVSIPLVHVVRYGGRCYLFNGYHRAVGVRRAGATHMPCVLRNVPDHNAVGMNPPDFFSAGRLAQPDPPTLGHFSQGRAYHVSLRVHSRIRHISWAEH